MDTAGPVQCIGTFGLDWGTLLEGIGHCPIDTNAYDDDDVINAYILICHAHIYVCVQCIYMHIRMCV